MYVLHTLDAYPPHGDIHTFWCTPTIQQMACQAACHQRGMTDIYDSLSEMQTTSEGKNLLVTSKNTMSFSA